MEAVAVTEALSSIWDLAADGMTFIQSNSVLFTMFCTSLISVAFMVIRKAKKSSH